MFLWPEKVNENELWGQRLHPVIDHIFHFCSLKKYMNNGLITGLGIVPCPMKLDTAFTILPNRCFYSLKKSIKINCRPKVPVIIKYFVFAA